MSSKATWRSGYAAVCKTVYPGSIPGVASNKLRVLNSRRQSSRFGGDVLRSVVLILAALALAACSLGGRFAYVRADGQDIGDPAVSQQFNRDRAVCQAEMHTSTGTGDPHRNNDAAGGSDAVQDCMEAKGYMVVMQNEAVAKARVGRASRRESTARGRSCGTASSPAASAASATQDEAQAETQACSPRCAGSRLATASAAAAQEFGKLSARFVRLKRTASTTALNRQGARFAQIDP
jgi:hypothetical protein